MLYPNDIRSRALEKMMAHHGALSAFLLCYFSWIYRQLRKSTCSFSFRQCPWVDHQYALHYLLLLSDFAFPRQTGAEWG